MMLLGSFEIKLELNNWEQRSKERMVYKFAFVCFLIHFDVILLDLFEFFFLLFCFCRILLSWDRIITTHLLQKPSDILCLHRWIPASALCFSSKSPNATVPFTFHIFPLASIQQKYYKSKEITSRKFNLNPYAIVIALRSESV